jgi:hypothetical protein
MAVANHLDRERMFLIPPRAEDGRQAQREQQEELFDGHSLILLSQNNAIMFLKDYDQAHRSDLLPARSLDPSGRGGDEVPSS